MEKFIRESIKADETASKIGMAETMEVFSLTYDHHAARFVLSLCYADGKTHTSIYLSFTQQCTYNSCRSTLGFAGRPRLGVADFFREV